MMVRMDASMNIPVDPSLAVHCKGCILGGILLVASVRPASHKWVDFMPIPLFG